MRTTDWLSQNSYRLDRSIPLEGAAAAPAAAAAAGSRAQVLRVDSGE